MMNIRPISDLRDNLPEIEETVKHGDAVYLTKNGYGAMVVLSMEQYAALTDETERKLNEADAAAATHSVRLTEDEVFDRARERIGGRKAL